MIFSFIKKGYQKVSSALAKTHAVLGHRIRSILSRPIDDDVLEELEEALYDADIGVDTASSLIETIRLTSKKNRGSSCEEILDILRDEVFGILSKHENTGLSEAPAGEPTVIFIVGVNGSGKTTASAKLAHALSDMGKSVMFAAADTFRAAATEQLSLWAERLGIDIVKGKYKSDPAAVVYDAVAAAKARNVDVIIIDTAGRLQAKTHLMHELEKMRRSCEKVLPGAPHETLLILDATIGQNAIDQALVFNDFTPLTGVVLTKLDGTAKGGIVVAVQQKLGIPVKFIGIGESLEDLEPFDAKTFTQALFEE
ncbi:MAG: signal recognition particle-docking protein FtsY [Waddliaceae bacterium]|nr:signal recognition particle-docking protein FtsY [Waddliaceae bacterium]MBT3578420.1 signal recognition particle-docking protein FtsY [Waddliaceae bacterium]MBT6929130.1 signal recognition particle-docking protein FtsY [Waddliaceae bacterium]MBT7264629.1 signal recognition particle-docking protein FtsY [Waddliaceae bacterium]